MKSRPIYWNRTGYRKRMFRVWQELSPFEPTHTRECVSRPEILG